MIKRIAKRPVIRNHSRAAQRGVRIVTHFERPLGDRRRSRIGVLSHQNRGTRTGLGKRCPARHRSVEHKAPLVNFVTVLQHRRLGRGPVREIHNEVGILARDDLALAPQGGGRGRGTPIGFP